MNVDRETVQNRSTDAVFERGENYRDEGRIQRLDRFDDLVTEIQGESLALQRGDESDTIY